MAAELRSLGFACLQLCFPRLFILPCRPLFVGERRRERTAEREVKVTLSCLPSHGPIPSDSAGTLLRAATCLSKGPEPLALLVSWPPFSPPSRVPSLFWLFSSFANLRFVVFPVRLAILLTVQASSGLPADPRERGNGLKRRIN